MPVSFSIDPSQRLLHTIVTGQVTRDEMQVYARRLHSHPDLASVRRRLVDVRAFSEDAEQLGELLSAEHDISTTGLPTDRYAIVIEDGRGPSLGRELVVYRREGFGKPLAYRVFRSAARAERYLRLTSPPVRQPQHR